MPFIISTTYSSSGGLAAATYACTLAQSVGCDIHLLHAYTVPVTFGDVPMPIIPVDDVLNITTERVSASIKQLKQQYPSVNITNEISYGDFEDLLEGEASKQSPLMAIVGNDEELESDIWIGGNASSLLRQAAIPVLAVPQSATYKTPVHVCLACDSKSISEGHPVGILLKLQSACNLQITVLHLLATDELPVNFEESALGKQFQDCAATYVEISASEGIDEAITSYAATHGMDWLAIIPHHYGFWEGLFHKSHTERMLRMANIPVLALH